MKTLKNLLKDLKSAINNMIVVVKVKTKKTAARIMAGQKAVRLKLAENQGQFIMDNAMITVIILVLGAIVITALTGLIQNDLIPSLRTKIMDFFS